MSTIALPSSAIIRRRMADHLRDKATDLRKAPMPNAVLAAESTCELAALVEHCDRPYPDLDIGSDRSVPMRGCRPVMSYGGSPAGTIAEMGERA